MKSDTLLDYAVFQLSPKGSRCELLVSSDGNTEKLASGLVKPFLDNLKFAEDQAAFAVQSIRLEIDRHKNVETWFTKGTFERFVRYVSTPETLEMVNTLDAEMSQLEAARKIYSQGVGDQRTDSQGGDGTGVIAVADATTKELLRAIDVRLGAVRQDLTAACARASASNFNPHTISQLKLFADRFGAHRLNEACTKYMSLYERRPDLNLVSYGKPRGDVRELRSSVNSDMSIDNDEDQAHTQAQAQELNESSTWQPPKSFATFASLRRNTNNTNNNNVSQKDEEAKANNNDTTTKEDTESSSSPSPSPPTAAPAARRLSVQDRINLFEKKQKENSSGKPAELRRLSSSDVIRRWSSSSDMSIDVSGGEKKGGGPESPLSSSASSVFQNNNKSISNTSSQDNNSDKVVEKTDQGSSSSSQETCKVSVFEEVGVSGLPLKGSSDRSEVVGSVLSSGDGVSDDVKFSGGVKSHIVAPSLIRFPRSHSRSLSAQFEGGGAVGLKSREPSSSLSSSVVVEGVDQSTPQPHLSFLTPEDSTKQQKEEDSQVYKTKYQKPQPPSQEQKTSMLLGKRDEIRGGNNESNKLNIHGKQAMKSQDNGQQLHRVRQSKGNQDMHDELKMKADELEKLFAEHKLRVPGDQSDSARRIEPADARVEQAINSQPRRPGVGDSTPQLHSRSTVSEQAASSGTKSVTKTPESHNYGDGLRRNFSDLSFGDDSRGKLYDKYMSKRNAKLQEEWSLNRAEKEARMKAMQDSLEQSRAEMKAKFSGSITRQGSAGAAQHNEKLGYFKSNIKRDQHLIDSLQNEEDEDLSEFSEEKLYGVSKQSKKIFPNRNVSSGTPRTTTVSLSRSSGRHRYNHLAQSVPNFSDLRKENTKPSSGTSKPTRSQVRNFSRSKSSYEEAHGIKEEKLRQSQSLRKSSANSAEFKDVSPLNSDEIVLTPLKFDLDETDLGPYDQSSGSFLKKGNPASAIRMKAALASGTQRTKEFDDMEFDMEDSSATEEQGEIGTMTIEDHAYNNNGKMSLSQESVKSGSEIGDSTMSLAQVEPISGGETPNAFPSSFNGVGSLQESPIGSPVSWNSRVPHPYSYPHESSDVDASVDSPIGSPWNSHSLIQGENDAARMRKKWGSAQKPFLATNPSQNQPRKDVTKGFKRLLKFGRKTRGSENLADWISATTSEGDDDMEDGRDLANRSSEDLRKSRMGFSHPSDDSFNESELFNEHVQSLQSSIPAPPAHFKLRDDHISGSSLKAPKSFFSLSTFRSKGSDSKPR